MGQTNSAAQWAVVQQVAAGLLVVCETVLLLLALVPQTTWASMGFPDGPIPQALAPVVAVLFYVFPSLIGLLCRRWQFALILATLPAWLDLLIFAVIASSHYNSPFYIAQDPHATGAVGTLELFAALGALGWVARSALRLMLAERGRREVKRA